MEAFAEGDGIFKDLRKMVYLSSAKKARPTKQMMEKSSNNWYCAHPALNPMRKVVRRKWQHQHEDAISQIQTISKTNHGRLSSGPDSYDHLHRSQHTYRSTTANTGRNFSTMKPMLATFGSIQSRPTYTGGKLMGTIWYYENWIVQYLLC